MQCRRLLSSLCLPTAPLTQHCHVVMLHHLARALARRLACAWLLLGCAVHAPLPYPQPPADCSWHKWWMRVCVRAARRILTSRTRCWRSCRSTWRRAHGACAQCARQPHARRHTHACMHAYMCAHAPDSWPRARERVFGHAGWGCLGPRSADMPCMRCMHLAPSIPTVYLAHIFASRVVLNQA